MVDFMKQYFLKQAIHIVDSMGGIYDPDRYFYMIETMENYGFTDDDVRSMLISTGSVEVNDLRIYAFDFLLSRYAYCYWNVVNVLTLKLLKMRVFTDMIPDLDGDVLYKVLMPERNNFYQVGDLSEKCDRVFANYYQIFTIIFKAAGWDIFDGFNFAECYMQPDEVITKSSPIDLVHDIIKKYISVITAYAEEVDEVDEVEYANVEMILLTSNQLYSDGTIDLIFEDFVPDGLVLHDSSHGYSKVLVVFHYLYQARGIELVIGREFYNMLTALRAYWVRLNNPSSLLEMK